MKDTLTIRLDSSLAAALDHEARNTGVSKGQIAREALEKRLRGADRLTVMKRHFGTATGPADLSVNKAYRRDWKKKRS
jgi:predicted transcriptional regulator